ncbi:hypothetical protein ACGF3G_04045 [Streptomyces sp. NPDC048179]|uniref:hypothetical protein n=1 Tax=Streptomyces sp. NPDC048179 TaxID=3365506 RepID=UPI003711281D
MRSGRSPTGVLRGSLDRLTATATGTTATGTTATGTTATGTTATSSAPAAVAAAPATPRVP